MVVGFFSVDPKRGQWISIEPTAGGWGGRADSDGESALINLVNGGFRNIPAEVMETKFPVRLEEFSMRADSAGPGKNRGGFGVTRRYTMLEDNFGAIWFERSKTPAWGLNGGKDGLGPEITVPSPMAQSSTPLRCAPAPCLRARLWNARPAAAAAMVTPWNATLTRWPAMSPAD